MVVTKDTISEVMHWSFLGFILRSNLFCHVRTQKLMHIFYWVQKVSQFRNVFFVSSISSKKTNKNTSHSSKNECICSFFGRIRGLTICFWNQLTFNIHDTKIAKKLPNKITLDLDTRSSTCPTRGQRVLRKLNCFKNKPWSKSRPVYFSEFLSISQID